MIVASGENVVVTLKNGTIIGQRTIGMAQNGGTLKIESGTYNCGADTGFWAGGNNVEGHLIFGTETGEDQPVVTAQEFCAAVGKNSSLVVNNGTFTSKDNGVFGGNGSATGYDGTEMTINNGTFNGEIKTAGYTGCGIYHPQNGKLTVNGGTFNINGVGICARAGQVEVNGGDFIITEHEAGWVGDKRTEISSNGIYYDGAANYPQLTEGAGSLTVSGGEFAVPEGYADIKVTEGNISIARDIADGYTVE